MASSEKKHGKKMCLVCFRLYKENKRAGTCIYFHTYTGRHCQNSLLLWVWVRWTSIPASLFHYFLLFIWLDLESPRRYTSGCILEGIFRELPPRRDEPSWMSVAPPNGLGLQAGWKGQRKSKWNISVPFCASWPVLWIAIFLVPHLPPWWLSSFEL